MQSLTLYTLSLIIVLIYTTILFFIAQNKKDNSIIDIAYGIGFIVTAYTLAIIKLTMSPLSIYSFLVLVLITIWGVRLSYRIYQKNKGKPEDFRYAAWRLEWKKKGKLYYIVRSYLQIFTLQGFVISIVLLPFTLSLSLYDIPTNVVWIGVLVWLLGFFFEVVGDKQLDTFIKNPNKTSTIMQTGLWKYTRHPNYFGESTMWWGLALISLIGSSSIFVVLSPILITYLLLFVSGIPMLEKKWEGIPEWEVYKKKTSAFLPLPPH